MEETEFEDVCIHCDGTGVFIQCAGTVDEREMKCVCKMVDEFEVQETYSFHNELHHV